MSRLDKKFVDIVGIPPEWMSKMPYSVADTDLGSEFYDKETADDMDAIGAMLRLSDKEGLQCEVVYQLLQGNLDNIPEACRCALYEWDI